MKTSPSHFVLAAEILTIILFHTVKIQQADKHAAEKTISAIPQNVLPNKRTAADKSGIQYMLVKLAR